MDAPVNESAMIRHPQSTPIPLGLEADLGKRGEGSRSIMRPKGMIFPLIHKAGKK